MTPVTEWAKRNSRRWNRPGFDQADTHPVVCVSTRDAMAYAEWLSRETGYNYRVPSASEWQYAARAGSHAAMLFVEPDEVDGRRDDRDVCRHGNVRDSSTGDEFAFKCSDGVRRTADVGQFPPSAVGLHDMVGNVSELVLTCIEVNKHDFLEVSSNRLPEDPDRCQKYLATTGSSWNSSPVDALDYREFDYLPSKPYRGTDGDGDPRYYRNSGNWIGFRVVRDLQE